MPIQREQDWRPSIFYINYITLQLTPLQQRVCAPEVMCTVAVILEPFASLCRPNRGS